MTTHNWFLSLAASAARMMPDGIKRTIYRVKPLARVLRGALNRAAPQGLTTVTIAAGQLAGLRMELDMQAEKDYWLGTYELDLQACLAEYSRAGMVAFDVGANIGYVSLLLAQATGPQGKVISFEALPANLERLRKNLTLNHLEERIEVVAAAVVDQPRPVQFLVGPSGAMGKAEGSAGRDSAWDGVSYNQAIQVAGLSLDNFVYEESHPAPQIVKMDIEGGEVLALPGMRHLLQVARPILLLELHGPQAAAIAWSELVNARYQVRSMQPGYPRIPSERELNWKSYLVAVPEDRS